MGRKSLNDEVESIVVVCGEEGPSAGSLADKVEKTRSRRKSYVMDLRIQSPAALGYMGIDGIDTAPALVRLAKVKGIDVIAVTDYYRGEYVDRILKAAEGTPITVIPGVLIRCAVESCDDVVLTCLFPESYNSAKIKDFLLALNVPQSAAGNRRYVVALSFQQVLEVVDSFGGVAIPSRMDKTPYRKNALPLLVEKYGFRAFDLAYYPESVRYFKQKWPRCKFSLMSFSNASALAQVGSRISKVKLVGPGFPGLKDLLGRTVNAG